MNELLSIDRGLALHLTDCAAEARSGIATGTKRKLKRLFCLDRGRLVYAASNVIEEQLSEVLVLEGLLSAARLLEAQQQARAGEVSLNRALADGGHVAEDELRRVFAGHVRGMLFDTLDWSEGECRFDPGMPDLKREYTVDLCPVALLAEYSKTHPERTTDLRMRIGPPNVRPHLRSDREMLLDRFEPDPAVRELIERCDGSRTVAQIVASCADESSAWRGLYTLVLTGALGLDTGDRGGSARPAGQITRSEVLARLERAAGADAYAVLEMNLTSTRDDIRSAYYFLARRYHPDRFRAGPLEDLLPQIESYFAQVTEAYNTLFDDERRKAYDQQRDSGVTTRAEATQDTRYLAKQNFIRAKSLIDKGRRTDAVQYLTNAIQLDAQQPDYHFELGRLLVGNPRRRDEAEQALLRTTELDPAYVDGYFVLGELYVKLGRLEEATRMFREVLSWDPGHVQASARLGELGTAEKRGLFRG